ncbi:hypothetical protein pb186bvf_004056 [Paramecium bursaria]
MMNKLFGGTKPQPVPQEKSFNQMSKEEIRDKQKEMNKQLNKEKSAIDRNNFQIEQQKKKAEADLQKEIKKGDKADKAIKQIYAKQVIQCNKNIERNMQNKGRIQNVQYSMDNMFANIKMAQAMGTISNVMKEINKCMNIKEISATMQELQKDMMKMGIIQEDMDDALNNMNDDVDLGDMENQVDNLILDMEKQAAGTQKNLPQQQMQQQQVQQFQQQEEDDMDKKLQAL